MLVIEARCGDDVVGRYLRTAGEEVGVERLDDG